MAGGQACLSCRAAAPEGLGSWFWPPRKTERVSCPKSGPFGITSRGNSQDTAIWHTFIGMPGFTGDQVGLPEVRDAGGAWLMFAGTPEAHIMLPGR